MCWWWRLPHSSFFTPVSSLNISNFFAFYLSYIAVLRIASCAKLALLHVYQYLWYVVGAIVARGWLDDTQWGTVLLILFTSKPVLCLLCTWVAQATFIMVLYTPCNHAVIKLQHFTLGWLIHVCLSRTHNVMPNRIKYFHYCGEHWP